MIAQRSTPVASYAKLDPASPLRVIFDRPQPIYSPGEQVTGRVLCETKGSRKVMKIWCKFRGKSCVAIRRTESSGPSGAAQTHVYRSKRYIVKDQLLLLDVDADCEGELTCGSHEFPFSFTIPDSGLPTFLHALGHVTYYVKAYFEKRPSVLSSGKRLFKTKHYNKTKPPYAMLVVLGNADPQSAHPSAPVTAKAKAGGLLGIIGGKPIFCSAQMVDSTALRFGATALISVQVDNQSNSKVDGIRAKLEHVCHFMAGGIEEYSTEVIGRSAVICSHKTDRTPVRKHTQRRCELVLQVPQCLPYAKAGAPDGVLLPLPKATAQKLAKDRPHQFVWPYTHHPSPTADPHNKALNMESYYQVIVKFQVKNGFSTKAKVPVTLHAGYAAADMNDYDDGAGGDLGLSTDSLFGGADVGVGKGKL